MTRNTLMILKIRSQRVMTTFPRRYQILMLRSLRTGMMKRMVSGLPQPLPTLSTRVHGRQRFVESLSSVTLRTGMMKRMVSGLPQPLPTLSYKGPWTPKVCRVSKFSNPEDWDDEEDGEWTAPTVANPEYKGPWTPKKIKNPNYKGKWKAPMIDNPGMFEVIL
nr:calreticulin [Ipomoea batatas]GMD46670.1 calreticulin [Ipomoea batatas]